MIFDAFYPPGLLIDERNALTRDLGDGLTLRYPRLAAPQVAAACNALRAAGRALRARSANQISTEIAAAAGQLSDPDNELGAQARRLIPRTTRYSPAMVDLVLRRMTADWATAPLQRLIVAELGDAACLDGFVEDSTGRRVHAFGPALTAHIFSGNVPGVAVTSLIRALLVKSPSFGKLAYDEPVLPVLFARALERTDPELAHALALTYWTGGDTALEAALFERADAVVVYGGADAVESARRGTRTNQRLIVHGPRFSIGAVHASALHDRTANDVAGAVAAFDQQGCVSPHVVYVMGASFEEAGTFAQRIAECLLALDDELPRGPLSAEEAVRMQGDRARAEFAAIGGASILMNAGSSYTVVADADPAFEPSCLNRFLYVKPVPDVAALCRILEPYAPQLQSVALAGFSETETAGLASELGSFGVTRFTTFAALPWPPAHWHHDGSSPLLELIRWTDWE